MTRKKHALPAEPPAESPEWHEARAIAMRCADQIRQYWLSRGYEVPVTISGSRIVLPEFPGGNPPAELKFTKPEDRQCASRWGPSKAC
jgi:hypothetical protein